MDATDLHVHLRGLEEALATRDHAAVPGGLASLIADDYVEHGVSGRAWDAETTRAALREASGGESVRPLDVSVALPAPDLAVVTYRTGPPRAATRISIWTATGGRWQVRFHLARPTT